MPSRAHWGAAQWAAYFEHQALPVMARSKRLLEALEESCGERLSPKDLSDIVLQDPMLCLLLLREAERLKSSRLGRETTTALAALLQLGVKRFRDLLLASPEVDETNAGLLQVEMRASLAAHIARVWSAGRMDVNPDEVAVAALLGGTGDLLLWAYAPELAQRAVEELRSGRAQRSAQAQRQACGFTFKDLTLMCAERWGLPALLILLLRGSNTMRARITRTCANTARHVLDDSENATLALAGDLVEASDLIANASVDWLAEALFMLPEARRLAALAEAQRQLQLRADDGL